MNSSSYTQKKLFKLKYYRQILTSLQFLMDILGILACFGLSYWIWNLVGPSLAIDMYEQLSISRYSLLFGLTALTLLIGFEVNDLYQPQRSLFNGKEFFLLVKTWFSACLITLIILFLANELYFSRGMFIITWLTLICFLVLERYAFFKFNSALRSMGIVETVVLIYGTGLLAKQLLSKIHQTPKLGYQIAGFIEDHPGELFFENVPILGSFESLKDVILHTQAEKLFIALSNVPSAKVVEILDVCRATGCQFQIIPSTYEMTFERIQITDVEGVPLIGIQEPRLSFLKSIIKRLFDLVLASILLLAGLPFFIFTYIVLVLKKRNPVFESEVKVGKNQSLYVQQAFNVHGSIIEVLRLHRYPQLLSVLQGKMSLIGPKPENRHVVRSFNEFQKHKLNVKPGVIGLWELNSLSKTDADSDQNMDFYYIRNQGLFLDVLIFIKVVFIIIQQIFAYIKGVRQPIA